MKSENGVPLFRFNPVVDKHEQITKRLVNSLSNRSRINYALFIIPVIPFFFFFYISQFFFFFLFSVIQRHGDTLVKRSSLSNNTLVPTACCYTSVEIVMYDCSWLRHGTSAKFTVFPCNAIYFALLYL